jgi:hyperosmotically inducible protein
MKKLLVYLFSVALLYSGIQTANAGTTIEDSAITTTVKSKMVANPLVSALDVKVKTNKGIVTLEGDVKTSSEADTAVEIASSVEGVTDVDVSHLHVKGSKHSLTDSIITAKVKGTYIREKIFGEDIALAGVHVETNDGVVYLKGEVTQEQANNAEKFAKLVKGVKNVKSDLNIKN